MLASMLASIRSRDVQTCKTNKPTSNSFCRLWMSRWRVSILWLVRSSSVLWNFFLFWKSRRRSEIWRCLLPWETMTEICDLCISVWFDTHLWKSPCMPTTASSSSSRLFFLAFSLMMSSCSCCFFFCSSPRRCLSHSSFLWRSSSRWAAWNQPMQDKEGKETNPN